MGPAALAQVLRPLKDQHFPPSLLVGLSAADDAAVYQVNEQQAIISTADFFPPVVDDPYVFGAVAAANAMSDVYAMGGEVLMAINLVAWPDDLDPALLSEILRGGAETVARAQAVIAGGHTVSDHEPKYGLAVTGSVHPQRIFTKGGAQPGDLLVLSKPLGTGLITTAHKREQVADEDLAAAVASMMRLNRDASRALADLAALSGGVHAVTDVTGFGLLGHAWEMASQSLTSMRFTFSSLPLLPHVEEYAARGCTPGGMSRNRAYFGPHVRLDARLDAIAEAILWDPQTSGGLLAAIAPELWPRLAALKATVPFWLIGEVTTRHIEEAQVLLEVY
ncbi:selenide, water dikinase SelD [Thermogemmatispora sp.]